MTTVSEAPLLLEKATLPLTVHSAAMFFSGGVLYSKMFFHTGGVPLGQLEVERRFEEMARKDGEKGKLLGITTCFSHIRSAK